MSKSVFFHSPWSETARNMLPVVPDARQPAPGHWEFRLEWAALQGTLLAFPIDASPSTTTVRPNSSLPNPIPNTRLPSQGQVSSAKIMPHHDVVRGQPARRSWKEASLGFDPGTPSARPVGRPGEGLRWRSVGHRPDGARGEQPLWLFGPFPHRLVCQ